MTAAKLVGPRALATPERAAAYFGFGADYVVDVADELGWSHGGLDGTTERARAALERGETELEGRERKLVGAVLVGDAEFWWPMGRWLPPGYALLMRGLSHALRRKLLRLAGDITGTLETGPREFYGAYPSVRDRVGQPEFSEPEDHEVDGRPPTEYVPGIGLDSFARRTVLGDSVLHVEWYEYVADAVDVDYDSELCRRARDESPAYFAGVGDELSDDVRELQRAMFGDAGWIREFHDHYELRSLLFRRAADAIERTADELSQPP
ncbi:MAG: hypothetical protein ACLFMT_05100 [Halobacteriales archaeon]